MHNNNNNNKRLLIISIYCLHYIFNTVYTEPQVKQHHLPPPPPPIHLQSEQLKNNYLPTNFYQSPLNNYLPPDTLFPSSPSLGGGSIAGGGGNYPFYNSYNPPTNSYPQWNYCIPPQVSPTYYVCPEPFYFFEYEPLISSANVANEEEAKARKNQFNFADFILSPYFTTQKPPNQVPLQPQNPSIEPPQQPFFPSKPPSIPLHPQQPPYAQPQTSNENEPEYRPQTSPNATITSSPVHGPAWQIIRQAYERCCPLNRNRLKPVQTSDEFSLYQRLFDSFGKLNNTLRGQGIYGIIENFNAFQNFEGDSQNPFSVPVLTSSGNI